MKVKRLPSDFVVEELPSVRPSDRGRFAFYRLSKSGLATLEAIEIVRRRWNLSGDRIGYGGLKDKHAETIQYLTILDGPDRPLRETGFSLAPLGRLAHPYGPNHFSGNRFEVVLRDLSAPGLKKALDALGDLAREGLPNYFDDQRFGSFGESREFIAHAWLLGDLERAFRLAVAEPNESDRPDAKTEKAVLRECWGNWSEAKAKLDRSHARSLVTYLVDHPTDFKGAFARIRRELRSLYFSAFQSHLWNLILGGAISRIAPEGNRRVVSFKTADLPMHRGLDAAAIERLGSLEIPLPSSRTTLPEGVIGEVAKDVMDAFGLVWEGMRVKHLKDVFFSKGSRPALFLPSRLGGEPAPDDLYPGRNRLRLTFDLPKGSYATIVVKRITDAS